MQHQLEVIVTSIEHLWRLKEYFNCRLRMRVRSSHSKLGGPGSAGAEFLFPSSPSWISWGSQHIFTRGDSPQSKYMDSCTNSNIDKSVLSNIVDLKGEQSEFRAIIVSLIKNPKKLLQSRSWCYGYLPFIGKQNIRFYVYCFLDIEIGEALMGPDRHASINGYIANGHFRHYNSSIVFGAPSISLHNRGYKLSITRT